MGEPSRVWFSHSFSQDGRTAIWQCAKCFTHSNKGEAININIVNLSGRNRRLSLVHTCDSDKHRHKYKDKHRDVHTSDTRMHIVSQVRNSFVLGMRIRESRNEMAVKQESVFMLVTVL